MAGSSAVEGATASYNYHTLALGIIVLVYLSTFVIFAAIRILTGVSIQRVGYLALRGIYFKPQHGVKVEIRRIGLTFHRPTFTQPTWISIVVDGSKVTLDLRDKPDEDAGDGISSPDEPGTPMARSRSNSKQKSQLRGRTKGSDAENTAEKKDSKLVEAVLKSKEALKQVHKWIRWIKLVDVVVSNTTMAVTNVGSVQVGSVTMLADTRRKGGDRNQMFDHCTPLKEGQFPVEWHIVTKNILLFTPGTKDPTELLDYASVTIYGVMEEQFRGIRDLAMSAKAGRIDIPCDPLLDAQQRLKALRKEKIRRKTNKHRDLGISLSTVMEEMSLPGSRTERMAEAVMESKEILNSLIRGIKEIQFAVGYLVISKAVSRIKPTGKPLRVLMSMKEFGMDVHRLDQKSPAHRMYFSVKDVAHQALLAAISISVSVDDGARQDKLVYIPMVTMTSRTTLLSKVIEIVEKSELNRNSNVLFANMVVTSPSIDLEPRHLPIVIALFKSKPKRHGNTSEKRAHLMSRFLPKANIKFSIQEPVIRILLPPTEPEFKRTDGMDMLISASSSVSLDLESFHEAEGQAHYSLSSTFRIINHLLYYRAASGILHDLMRSETLDLKLQLNATPEVQVVANANLNTFTLRLVRPEIVQGLKQMITQFKRKSEPDKMRYPESKDARNFLRQLPLWLDHFKVECNDITIEVAGIDEEVSGATLGVALQMDEWSINYMGKKNDMDPKPTPLRRRVASRTVSIEDIRPKEPPIPVSKSPTDGRSLKFNFRGVHSFIVESEESWENDAFISLPHIDFSLHTGSDLEGPMLHFGSSIKSIFLHYSMYRHHCVLVAAKVLKETFGGSSAPETALPTSPNTLDVGVWGDMDLVESPISTALEFRHVDVKITHIKIKASFPDDPPLMMELHGVDAGRHRWGFPFFKSKYFRLYVESPKMRNCWARMVSIRQLRVDMREMRRKNDGNSVEEKSLDLTADAIRVAVPHQVTVYHITDNIVNTVKASEQMHHRFNTGTNEYIVEKGPEGPKHVPRMTLRTRALLLELEDDPFETKLGLIYRVGLVEQKKRLARLAAFDAKVKKMEESQSRRSWETTRTSALAHEPAPPPKPRRMRTWRSEHPNRDPNRTEDPDGKSKWKHMRRRSGGVGMRYNPENAYEPSNAAAIGIDDAWERLMEHESSAWIKRIQSATEKLRARSAHTREAFWGEDDMPADEDDEDEIVALPQRPSLMAAYFNDAQIVVDKPSFPLQQLPKFLHRVGKGLPEDTLFALLIPLNIKINFGEGKVLLRDYPLPFIHVPPMRVGQSSRLHSWSLESDFVIAEEFRGPECLREKNVCVVPATKDGPGLAVNVKRTVSAVKSYSDIKVAINTSYATRITWCMSYQPAIQDMMMAFETLTKPHVDPSERVGFWDKIRLVFHSMLSLSWNGDGDVHLFLKGSRDPYKITGEGTGFAMCWRGNVNWNLGRDPSPEKGIQVESGEFLLAVPDFTRYAAEELDSGSVPDSKSFLSANSISNGALFKKIIMKLSGKIHWLVGLMFEQELTTEEDWKLRKRSFEFKPHYEVTLRAPEHAKAPPGEVYDAFRGFRSHHLHLSLAIIAPADREWRSSATSPSPSKSYNTIHLTPRFFTHFYAWWDLFSGPLSLPVRQGDLWPGLEKSSKKLGHHLATIKYKLCLAPLFISHIYKHSDRDEDGHEITAATGLKAKLESFTLDMHQRREEVLTTAKSSSVPNSVITPNVTPPQIITTTTMRLNEAELDFHNADIRAVSAIIDKLSLEDRISRSATISPDNFSDEFHLSDDIEVHAVVEGDRDMKWVDMDDFVEIDWMLPKGRPPRVKILPLAFTPRFTYFRQTEHADPEAPGSVSSFGHEPTHSCIISQDKDPREIQCALVQARLERVNQQMSRNREALARLSERTKANPDQDAKRESQILMDQSSILYDKLKFLQNMLRQISSKLDDKNGMSRPGTANSGDSSNSEGDRLFDHDDSAPLDYSSDFDNRFIVHNMQAKWNNSLRNVIFKYIHQVNQRRGFVYYMSRRAVKFILDLIEEQKLSGQEQASGYTEWASTPSSADTEDPIITERIQKLLDDEIKVAVADDNSPPGSSGGMSTGPRATDDLAGDLAKEYVPQNSYHVRLIAPQIQLQSEKNEGSAVLVVAQGMQLKIVSVMDRERIGDDVSGLVQRRFALNLENTQFFVSRHQDFSHQSMYLHSANRYGAGHNSSWPPWVPLESMFDFRNNPVGFSRVVERTSATLRYEKHNSLRLKYGDRVSELQGSPSATKNSPIDTERPVDTVSVDFPRVEASCDSSQYFAMYIIVLDLLLYTDPAEKSRNEMLEKIMLASDFTDLTGASEMVERLQGRIHQLEEIKEYFEMNQKTLDLEGWKSSETVDQDLARYEDELFFLMNAITRAQRKLDERVPKSSTILKWYLTASEIVWHLLCEQVNNKRDSLMDISLNKAFYKRSDNQDGSNSNEVEVQHIKGYNLLPESVYPEMITAYFRDDQSYVDFGNANMLRVSWNMLDSVGGIPIVESFEVNVHPMKVQLERDVGERIFEYIFPGVRNKSGENNGFSPFMVNSMKPIVDTTEEQSAPDFPVLHTPMDESESETSRHSSEIDYRLRPTLSLTPGDRPSINPLPPRPNTAHSSASFFASSSRSIVERYNADGSGSRTVMAETISASTTTRKSLESRPPLAGRSKSTTLFARPQGHHGKQPSDDLSQMMSRASNYMMLSYIKIVGVTLCLSYKGRGESNLEDIHEFVFRLPDLEYRNKCWSNYDLAMHLKKDVIRALISHTGAILQNKLTNHRPSRQTQNQQKKKSRLGNLGNKDQSSNSLTVHPNNSGGSSSSSLFNFRITGTPNSANGSLTPNNDIRETRSPNASDDSFKSFNRPEPTTTLPTRDINNVSRASDRSSTSSRLGIAGLDLMGQHDFNTGYSAFITSDANRNTNSNASSGVERFQSAMGRLAGFGTQARVVKDNGKEAMRPHTANPAGGAGEPRLGSSSSGEGGEASGAGSSVDHGEKKKKPAGAMLKKVFGGGSGN
ncbi:hypothetical protein EX30DRAFT_53272 [Ascodesmis nigricans]|uniref:Uncharacterized protein n=1 Tax=Ascodesmis nigricans TaxID=341454 RepID=A0A4S2MVH2_9PEZI|nr:hypothetical protein EX30DRAFT_53272 [Ascodesmis nigricans]